jgi:hypothetical protein
MVQNLDIFLVCNRVQVDKWRCEGLKLMLGKEFVVMWINLT